jgi:hypothetical protein
MMQLAAWRRNGCTLQVAAGTIYWEWKRGVLAAEAKKAAEAQQRHEWEATAQQQRQVRNHAWAPALSVSIACKQAMQACGSYD